MAEVTETGPVEQKNPFLDYVSSVLDECEKKDQISSTVDDGYVLSTGLLSLDIVMNGGIRSGWITSSGLEASGKSSLAIKMLGSLAKKNIPGYFIDSEGSLDTEYACNVAGISDISEYFGRPSPKGKGWEIPPKIRYTSENTLEKVFSFMQRILLRLPDKLYRQEEKKWYYVFSKEKADVEIMQKLGLKHSLKLYSQTGRYWCEAPDGNFQMVFILDSLPGLVTQDVAEDADGGSKAMALQARALSKAVPPVRGLLRRKHAVFLVINQLRQAPGVMFGPSEYEPCGNYVKFASDVRNTLNSRSVPDPFDRGKTEAGSPTGTYGQEPSVEGEGTDTYMYKLIKNTKNKRGTPFRQGWCRLWISDYKSKARGFDPVFDCYKYLETTNQAHIQKKGGRREIIGLDKFFPELKGKPVQWLDFKLLILGLVQNNNELLEKFKEKYEIPLDNEMFNLYNHCFEQIESGEAFNLMLDSNQEIVKDDSEDIDSFEDLDDSKSIDSEDDFS